MGKSAVPFLCVIVVSLGSAPGEGIASQDILFPPLITVSTEDGRTSTSLLGPLVAYDEGFFAVRPLFTRDRTKDVTTFLYPLGKSTPEGTYFVPLMRSGTSDDHRTFDLFPYFSGTYRNRPYSGVFPLYGRMEHRLGFDEAEFFLWPLYSRTTTAGVSTRAVFWPVFSWSDSGMFRVFPLFGRETEKDTTRTFALWPVFHLERSPERLMLAALPLFRYETGPSHGNLSIVWPLFSYSRDDAAGHTSVDAPWPLVRFASGGYEETRLFPLFWAKEEGPSYRYLSVAWPLWSSSSSAEGEVAKTASSVLILNRYTTTRGPEGVRSRSLTLWPLFHFSRDGTRSRWFFPAIVPLFHDEPFMSSWGEVLTLAKGSSGPEGVEWDILWKTLSVKTSPAYSRWWFSFLVSHEQTLRGRRWGFLGGLIGTPRPKEQAEGVN